MWHASNVVTAPSVEPVTLAQAKDQCGILDDDADFDVQIARLIKAARSHVESYCGVRWAEQTITCSCDGFDDLARLPEGPLKSVTTLTYIDPAGAEQTVPETVFLPNKDGIEPSIRLKHGQSWPAIQRGSRVTLVAVYGGDVPEEVQHAMLLFVADSFLVRETAERNDWTTLDALLCNNRRGA